jgi:hypothetical protein
MFPFPKSGSFNAAGRSERDAEHAYFAYPVRWTIDGIAATECRF